ncbi:unnamed protein product [Prorocentrum cordatum]|uniref:Transmembrane protein 107 n=1 Tax=Prorocentrum cordatum TaxID=2364126 RepID=A0ABN9T7V6_9DINO|nr:unnamed protein product [Polarella glacialis]
MIHDSMMFRAMLALCLASHCPPCCIVLVGLVVGIGIGSRGSVAERAMIILSLLLHLLLLNILVIALTLFNICQLLDLRASGHRRYFFDRHPVAARDLARAS